MTHVRIIKTFSNFPIWQFFSERKINFIATYRIFGMYNLVGGIVGDGKLDETQVRIRGGY